MSALGSLAGMFGGGGGFSSSSSARADDSGVKSQNTPVNVVAGNTNVDLAGILGALTKLNAVENQPALGAINLPSGGGGSSGLLLVIGAGVLLWLITQR